MTSVRPKRGPDKEARGKSRRLTSQEFEAVLPFLNRFAERSVQAARMAMVDGKKFDDVAAVAGWKSRQAVERVVRAVWQVHLRLIESKIASSGENDG